ncbi:3'-phosphoesterase [archaeon SCG-AAA382B04]|nr:3'-phosphoesterase [archaeon SCG-AAA382B04]
MSNRFVVQKHDAQNLHYDFRLEIDGVLKSWTVPKGIPQEDGEKNLAIRTKDHEIDYIDFEGKIPEGEYGAGEVEIWDEGKYEIEKKEEEELKFKLSGEKISGKFVIVPFESSGDEDNYLLIKLS